MKKIISIILISLFIFAFSSCTDREDFDTFEYFEVVVYEGNMEAGWFLIYRDIRTDVMYQFYKIGYGGGLSVMYNKDGSVMTYNDWCKLTGGTFNE